MTFRKAINFLRHDIWHIHLGSVSRKKSFLIRLLRVIVLALHGLDEDRCSLRASALTFYSMLSIVPVAALTFGMAKWFGLQKILENELLEKGKGQEEVISWVITFANSLLEDAKGGLIAGVGIVMLLWLIIRLLGNIEKSFNEI
ncbi:MAG: YihY/virulence factor BrkB family protein, partial [Deltaproteobacteria bacterium]|nr:YihY/virulence factor BrkB family protein [Deltaproteobacteria bacterium]